MSADDIGPIRMMAFGLTAAEINLEDERACILFLLSTRAFSSSEIDECIDRARTLAMQDKDSPEAMRDMRARLAQSADRLVREELKSADLLVLR